MRDQLLDNIKKLQNRILDMEPGEDYILYSIKMDILESLLESMKFHYLIYPILIKYLDGEISIDQMAEEISKHNKEAKNGPE